jgi:hypothetical protein
LDGFVVLGQFGDKLGVRLIHRVVMDSLTKFLVEEDMIPTENKRNQMQNIRFLGVVQEMNQGFFQLFSKII